MKPLSSAMTASKESWTGFGETKSDSCTCQYPEVKFRNGSGHAQDCPIHREWLQKKGWETLNANPEGHNQYTGGSGDKPKKLTKAQERDARIKAMLARIEVPQESGVPAEVKKAALGSPFVGAVPPTAAPGKVPQEHVEAVVRAVGRHGGDYNLADIVHVRQFLSGSGITTMQEQNAAIQEARKQGKITGSA